MIIAVVLLLSWSGPVKAEKRLLLADGNEIDFVQEFANINRLLEEHQRQIKNLTQENEALKKTISNLNAKDSGSTYVRWGRTTCPNNNTDLVYHGYMASSSYTTAGGGVNYLCLSPDPQWSHYDESITSGNTLRGVEYEFYTHRSDGAAQFFGKDVYNDDAVCAVCYVPRVTNMMIPGRKQCYSGWTKEYSGYLVSTYDGATHEADYICLDDRPEAQPGGKNNDDEGLLYFVEATCGKGLECPPYIQGRELTCVVCSK